MFTSTVTLTVTADDRVMVYDGGRLVFGNGNWMFAQTVTLTSSPCLLAVAAQDYALDAGILASTSTGVVTDTSWKCSAVEEAGWYLPSFDDSDWSNAKITGTNDVSNQWQRAIAGISAQAKWIWADVTSTVGFTYCRKSIC